jgi:hypothetical protein
MARRPPLVKAKSSPQANANNYFYTKGGEFSLNGEEYIGEYHLIAQTAFTGPIHNESSTQLRRFYAYESQYTYDQLFNFLVPASLYIDPVPYTFSPTETQYTRGFAPRYFVEKLNDENSYAVEIDLPQYQKLGKIGGIDGGLYSHTTVEWKLTGTANAISLHNEIQMRKAELIVPSALFCITSYTEFGRITQIKYGLSDTPIRTQFSFPKNQEVRQAILDLSLSVSGSV